MSHDPRWSDDGLRRLPTKARDLRGGCYHRPMKSMRQLTAIIEREDDEYVNLRLLEPDPSRRSSGGRSSPSSRTSPRSDLPKPHF